MLIQHRPPVLCVTHELTRIDVKFSFNSSCVGVSRAWNSSALRYSGSLMRMGGGSSVTAHRESHSTSVFEGCCVCVYVCVYVCMHVYMCVCESVHVCTCTCIHAHTCIHTWVCMYVYACMHVCMLVCLRVCVYNLVYVCVCITLCTNDTCMYPSCCVCMCAFITLRTKAASSQASLPGNPA